MRIIVNGEPSEHPDGLTVSGLLTSLGLEPQRVAVERNQQIVPRSRHVQTSLAEGDRLEIVTLVGGG
jgi:sulfur carrier protein